MASGEFGEKLLGAETRTNGKLKSFMSLGPEVAESGPLGVEGVEGHSNHFAITALQMDCTKFSTKLLN